jgi:hypothetical protein
LVGNRFTTHFKRIMITSLLSSNYKYNVNIRVRPVSAASLNIYIHMPRFGRILVIISILRMWLLLCTSSPSMVQNSSGNHRTLCISSFIFIFHFSRSVWCGTLQVNKFNTTTVRVHLRI